LAAIEFARRLCYQPCSVFTEVSVDGQLAFWRRIMLGLAAVNVVAGLAGERFGGFRALRLDGLSAFFWGVLYAVLAWMVSWRPRRCLIAVVVWAIVDGVRLAFAAGDTGDSAPLLAIALRVAFAVPAVKAALVAQQALEEAAGARRPPPVVAKVANVAGRPTEPRSPTVRPAVGLQERQGAAGGTSPAPGRLPRATGSVLTTGTRASTVSMRTPTANVDSAASALRFVARSCEVGGDGLRMMTSDGQARLLAWEEVGEIWARSLPAERPWDGQALLEIAPKGQGVEPVRVFATTRLSWPGAAAPSVSRLANLRRLCVDIAGRATDLVMDEQTRRFMNEGTAPHALARMDDLAERDARYTT
jgi:hypothetical protein